MVSRYRVNLEIPDNMKWSHFSYLYMQRCMQTYQVNVYGSAKG